MPRHIDPATLLDQPLMLGRIGEDDNAVRVAGLGLGRIMARPMFGGRTAGFCTLTGPGVSETLGPTLGNSESLDGAKVDIKRAFGTWLLWAHRLGEVVWRG